MKEINGGEPTVRTSIQSDLFQDISKKPDNAKATTSTSGKSWLSSINPNILASPAINSAFAGAPQGQFLI